MAITHIMIQIFYRKAYITIVRNLFSYYIIYWFNKKIYIFDIPSIIIYRCISYLLFYYICKPSVYSIKYRKLHLYLQI